MRFKSNIVLGKTVTKNKFAWLPIEIKGETRWMERVKYEGHYWEGNLFLNWSSHKFVD